MKTDKSPRDGTIEKISLVRAINMTTDDLIVTGSLAQFLHLGEQHRKISDIDIVLFNSSTLRIDIEAVNRILGTNYQMSSHSAYEKGDQRIKLVRSENVGHRIFKTYVGMDIKNKKEMFETMDDGLRIVMFEQFLSNKIATTLIGDNKNHYIRIKDFYDLYFLLDKTDYDFDVVLDILCQRLANNGISNIFNSFLFNEMNDPFYRVCFRQVQEKYGMDEEIDLFFIRDFLIDHEQEINKRLQRVKPRNY